MKLTLDVKGKASTGEVLPYGTYELTETKANDWYEINDDPIKKAGLAVYKVDQNLKRASAQGDATLTGAVYLT